MTPSSSDSDFVRWGAAAAAPACGRALETKRNRATRANNAGSHSWNDLCSFYSASREEWNG
jgi:hypothetical protein